MLGEHAGSRMTNRTWSGGGRTTPAVRWMKKAWNCAVRALEVPLSVLFYQMNPNDKRGTHEGPSVLGFHTVRNLEEPPKIIRRPAPPTLQHVLPPTLARRSRFPPAMCLVDCSRGRCTTPNLHGKVYRRKQAPKRKSHIGEEGPGEGHEKQHAG